MKLYTYLALGDSYTIGESVPPQKNFPYQTVRLLGEKGMTFSDPEIIAKTGWTTDELANALSANPPLPFYDWATLLIGVNNQYRGRPVEEYEKQFTQLLIKAIALTRGNPTHVFVLSIPDYGVTPSGRALEESRISREIDAFNEVNKRVSHRLGAGYIDVTRSSRQAKYDPSLFAEDGLHPSEKEYGKWAEKLSQEIEALLK